MGAVWIALQAGCGGSSPPPAPPEAQTLPPDSPLARIHPDMGMREVTSILGEPYDTTEYTTGKQFIPFYNTWGGDQYRIAWRYRGIGRVIFTRHNAYVTDLRVLKVEYDPNEGGGPPPVAEGPPPAPPPPPPGDPPADAPEPSGDSYDDNDPSALTDFRSNLDPYGTWVDDPTYGTVWIPFAGPDFMPYETAGHWVHDDDWVWVSDYEWGSIPFHYGRWVPIEGRGWGWIPGREYRGAWVTWQVDDGYSYMGWAPAPPEFLWRGGAPVVFRAEFAPHYFYVPRADVFSPVVGTHIVRGDAAIAIRGRMHVLAPDRPGGRVAGPRPERFGYTADRIPHASGAEKAKLAHAQQLARPSTARAVGGHEPTRRGGAEPRAAAGEPRAGGRAPGAAGEPRGAAGEPAGSSVHTSEERPGGTKGTNEPAHVTNAGTAGQHAEPAGGPRPSGGAPPASHAPPPSHPAAPSHSGGNKKH